MSGDYFVVTSFGIQLLATAVFTNWTEGTGGANGLPGIPPPDMFGCPIETTAQFMLLCTARGAARLPVLLPDHARAVRPAAARDPRGRDWRSPPPARTCCAPRCRPPHWPARSPAPRAGCTRTFLSFIDPSSFDLDASILLLTMVVVGGARTLAGSIIGPFLLLALPQLLTLVEIPTTIAAAARQLIYGLLLILFMLFRPQGLAGERL